MSYLPGTEQTEVVGSDESGDTSGGAWARIPPELLVKFIDENRFNAGQASESLRAACHILRPHVYTLQPPNSCRSQVHPHKSDNPTRVATVLFDLDSYDPSGECTSGQTGVTCKHTNSLIPDSVNDVRIAIGSGHDPKPIHFLRCPGFAEMTKDASVLFANLVSSKTSGKGSKRNQYFVLRSPFPREQYPEEGSPEASGQTTFCIGVRSSDTSRINTHHKNWLCYKAAELVMDSSIVASSGGVHCTIVNPAAYLGDDGSGLDESKVHERAGEAMLDAISQLPSVVSWAEGKFGGNTAEEKSQHTRDYFRSKIHFWALAEFERSGVCEILDDHVGGIDAAWRHMKSRRRRE